MHKILLTIKDDSKINFLLELIKQFDFIEINDSAKKSKSKHKFFESAGIWEHRDISAETLRAAAWKRHL